MSKQKDTSWELPAGIRNTGVNNLTKELGSRSREIVQRLNNDNAFTIAASKALITLYDNKAPQVVRPTMEKIKLLMGGRCFLPEEIESLIGLQHHEVASIPRFTGHQIEQLECFLKSRCPILGTAPASETHILFPQPSTISGSTFGVDWVLKNSQRKWGIKISLPWNQKIPDRFFNKIRNPQWLLMFWGTEDESAVPCKTDVQKLLKVGYSSWLAGSFMSPRGCEPALAA